MKNYSIDKSDRRANGQFTTGNRCGRGNPFSRRHHAAQKIIRSETKPDDIRAIWRQLLELAKSGDLVACKLVLDRVLGRVPAEPEPLSDDTVTPAPRVILLDWRKGIPTSETEPGENHAQN